MLVENGDCEQVYTNKCYVLLPLLDSTRIIIDIYTNYVSKDRLLANELTINIVWLFSLNPAAQYINRYSRTWMI